MHTACMVQWKVKCACVLDKFSNLTAVISRLVNVQTIGPCLLSGVGQTAIFRAAFSESGNMACSI